MKKISTFLLLTFSSLVYASVGDTITCDGAQYVVKSEDSVSNIYEVKITNYLASRIVVPDSVVSSGNTYFVTDIPAYYDSVSCRLSHYTMIDYGRCRHLHTLNYQSTIYIDIDTLILPPDIHTIPSLSAFFSATAQNRKRPVTDPDKLQPGIHRIFSSGHGNPNLPLSFSMCGALQEVDLSSYTVPIEVGYDLSRCYFLERCILPDSYKNRPLKREIGCLFGGDMRLTYFNMPDSIECIEANFATGVPVSLLYVGPKCSIAMQGLYSWQYMDSVSVDPTNPTYCAVDGVLFSKDTTCLIHYPYSRDANVYILPPQTRLIGCIPFQTCLEPEEYAKVYRHQLKSSAGSLHTLVINDELEEIVTWDGFEHSSIRKIVNLENSNVRAIGWDGFNGSRIDSILLPASIKCIGAYYNSNKYLVWSLYCLANMRNLRRVDFSRADSLEHLGPCTFLNDIIMDSLDLMHCSLLKVIREQTCMNDSGLRYVTLPRYIDTIKTEAFAGCVSLNKLVCPAFTPIRLTPGMKVFDGVNTSTCELIVPSKSVPLYLQAPVWKDFQISSNGLYTIEGLPSDSLGGMVSGTGAYLQGETATLTALPTEGYEFISWDDGNTDNPRQVLAAQDTTLVALFQLISGLTHTENDAIDPMQKTMKNGNIYIQRGEYLYTIHGEVIQTNK